MNIDRSGVVERCRDRRSGGRATLLERAEVVHRGRAAVVAAEVVGTDVQSNRCGGLIVKRGACQDRQDARAEIGAGAVQVDRDAGASRRAAATKLQRAAAVQREVRRREGRPALDGRRARPALAAARQLRAARHRAGAGQKASRLDQAGHGHLRIRGECAPA